MNHMNKKEETPFFYSRRKSLPASSFAGLTDDQCTMTEPPMVQQIFKLSLLDKKQQKRTSVWALNRRWVKPFNICPCRTFRLQVQAGTEMTDSPGGDCNCLCVCARVRVRSGGCVEFGCLQKVINEIKAI